MGMGRTSLSFALALSLTACGGGGGSSGGPTFGNGGGTPTPTPSTASCSLSARQDFAKSVIDEWFLYPELIDNSVNKANYSSVQAYIDAVLRPFFQQKKNAQFTYITSIKEEEAFYNSGASAGFGFRLSYDTSQNRVYVLETFEGTAALAAGIDRGTEILAIGTTSSNLVTVSSLLASGGPQAVVNALGPNTAGTARVLRVNRGGTVSEVTVTKTDYSLDPVSNRYGALVLNDGGKQVGYINLRTFIDTAEADLRTAFATFKAQGITEVIVDVRYNGGGLVSIANLFGDLLGANRVGQVFSYTTFRQSKAPNNSTRLFTTQPQAIGATKIAFIGSDATASASELLAASFIPYLGTNTALIGSNTYGKPVGQIAIDKPECDDRMRVVAFKTENANRQGDYFGGLASIFQKTCAAPDDISRPLGDPSEAQIKAALDFLAGRACTPIGGAAATAGAAQKSMSTAPERELIRPSEAGTPDREAPGRF